MVLKFQKVFLKYTSTCKVSCPGEAVHPCGYLNKLWIQKESGHIVVPSLLAVWFGNFLDLTMPQFPLLWKGDNNSTYLIPPNILSIKRDMYVKCLAQSLVLSNNTWLISNVTILLLLLLQFLITITVTIRPYTLYLQFYLYRENPTKIMIDPYMLIGKDVHSRLFEQRMFHKKYLCSMV